MNPAPHRQHVFLVPGFFGFVNLGELTYFGHVKRSLDAWAEAEGASLEVHRVRTPPTASLARRAAVLFAAIDALPEDEGDVHIVGHSAGGLDARLLLTPGATLPGIADPERVAARVRSLVCLTTPHRGTPLADVFTSAFGQQLLEVLSLATIVVLRRGTLPARMIRDLAGLVVARGRSGLAQIQRELLTDVEPPLREAVQAFASLVRDDRALLPQLSPQAAEVFEAAAPDRAGVRYASVVARARRPDWTGTLAQGWKPVHQASHVLYSGMWKLAGSDVDGRDDWGGSEQGARDGRTAANDGMVPVWSQIRGLVLDEVMADHLDVLGHFNLPTASPAHHDWIRSGSGFTRARYDLLWDRIARFCLLGEAPEPTEERAPR